MAILVIDDDIINLEILIVYLKESKYAPVCVRNGEEALTYLARSHDSVELILLDLSMPRMDGFEFLEKLRSYPHLKNIPIVVQSVLDITDFHKKSKKAGGVFYLQKPYEKPQLLSMITKALRK